MLIERGPRVTSDPGSYFVALITGILEMNAAKHSAVSIVDDSLCYIRDSASDDLADRGHIAAELDIDSIPAVPELDNCSSSCAKRCMGREVVLMIGCRIKERYPGSIGIVLFASGENLWILNRSDWSPGAIEVSAAESDKQGVILR